MDLKYPVFTLLFLFFIIGANCQCDPPGSGSGETCQDPVTLCAGSIPVSTSGFAPDPPLVFCGGGATTENNSWVEFVAACSPVCFDFTLTSCAFGNGVQAVIFEAIGGDCNALVELACFNPGGGGAQDFTVCAGVTAGNTYLLMIDGYAGDQCEFDVSHDCVETSPTPPAPPIISGPLAICSDTGPVTYTVTNPDPNATYNWYSPGSATGTTYTVDLSGMFGTVDICVEAFIPCVPECECITVTVEPPVTITFFPYDLVNCWWPQMIVPANISGPPGYTILWTTIDGLIISGEDTPLLVVGSAGTYTITITTPAGCIVEATAIVLEDLVPPVVTLIGGILDCNFTSTVIQAITEPTVTSFNWSGPGGFSASDPSIVVTEPGLYTVTVTDDGGCETVESILIEQDITPPDASAMGGTITCCTSFPPSVQIIGSSTTPGAQMGWIDGPNGFMAPIPDPFVTEPGIYTFGVMGPNGCTTTVEVFVIDDSFPPVGEVEDATITCTEEEVELAASSGIPGATFNWSGPGGFQSTSPVNMVSIGGNYRVTITNPANCCELILTAAVEDVREYPDILLTGGLLDCNVTEFEIMSSSSFSPLEYNWEGPGGWTSDEANPIVTLPGTYNLTVTTEEGCSSVASTFIVQDVNIPTVNTMGGIITCQSDFITISVTTSDYGATFLWEGPGGYSSDEQYADVTEPGTYFVTVTGGNGCTNFGFAVVTLDDDVPTADVQGGNITCLISSITLMGSSTGVGVIYTWTGPNGFTSTVQNPVVTIPGVYVLTVRAPNGCESTSSFVVEDETGVPDFSLVPDTIGCFGNDPTIHVISSDSLTFVWSGPNGFTSTAAEPDIQEEGMYFVTITDEGGCTNEGSIEVTSNTDAPQLTLGADVLTCALDTITPSVSSDLGIQQYTWTGPNGFSSSDANPEIFEPGTYTLSVVGTNGCTSMMDIVVDGDFVEPDLNASGGLLTCVNDTILITGTSVTPGVTYSWSGPNGYTGNGANTSVYISGTYTVTATGPNGCESSMDVMVDSNQDTPTADATGGIIDCNNPILNITGTTDGTNPTYSWTGPNGFNNSSAAIDVDQGGDYQLIVTTEDGCKNSITVQVTEDFVVPDIQAQGGLITCLQTTVQLNGVSMTPGAMYSWTGPNNYTSTLQNPVVNTPGLYTLTVIAPNGCSNQIDAQVDLDANVPVATVTGGLLDCNNPEIQLMGSSNVPGVTYNWTGPSGFTSTDQNPLTSMSGDYVLTIMLPNGCESNASITINEDFSTPDGLINGDTLDCFITSVQLISTTSVMGSQYSWSGPGGFTSLNQNPTVTQEGLYTLTITGPNGCSDTFTYTVETNADIPTLNASGGLLTCEITSIQIQASSTDPTVTYTWTGPSNFSSFVPDPMVSFPGLYTIIIEAPNGCRNQVDVMVDQDIVAPNIDAVGGIIDCNNESVILQGIINTPGVITDWTGPDGYTTTELNPEVYDAGVYTLNAYNPTNGCVSSSVADVILADEVPQGLEMLLTTPSCIIERGRINIINVEGGTGPYEYSFNGGSSFDESGILDDLGPGSYSVLVRDSKGCTYEEDIEIPDFEPVTLFHEPIIEISLGENSQFDAIVNLQPHEILSVNWTPSDFLSCTDCLEPFVDQPTRTVKYFVKVRDIYGCEAKAEVVLRVLFDPKVYIPNVFSPNDDGINDAFMIFGDPSQISTVHTFEVFDRWGEKVYGAQDFKPNDPVYSWDGHLKGEKMNSSVFAYWAEIEFINGEKQLFKGNVTLVR